MEAGGVAFLLASRAGCLDLGNAIPESTRSNQVFQHSGVMCRCYGPRTASRQHGQSRRPGAIADYSLLRVDFSLNIGRSSQRPRIGPRSANVGSRELSGCANSLATWRAARTAFTACTGTPPARTERPQSSTKAPIAPVAKNLSLDTTHGDHRSYPRTGMEASCTGMS